VSTGKTERLERARRLMMAALDDELAGGEREELDRLLAEDAELRQEWERLNKVKEVTATMDLRSPPEEIWDRYFGSVYNRLERGVAWILVSLGAIVLAGYGMWELLTEMLADTGLPGFVKIAVFAVLLGGVILLVSVIRERLFVRRKDPYKEIDR
jgi:ferric-dicitrate binding protein FerR (iron transport regulator)